MQGSFSGRRGGAALCTLVSSPASWSLALCRILIFLATRCCPISASSEPEAQCRGWLQTWALTAVRRLAVALRRVLHVLPRPRTSSLRSSHLRGCAPGMKEEPRSLPPHSGEEARRMGAARGGMERLRDTVVSAAARVSGEHGAHA